MGQFCRLRNGRHGMILYNQHDECIGRSIDLYGEWAEAEIELWKQFLHPGMTVLDIGAYIGTHTLALSSLVGDSGRVVAFEPQRLIFYMLAGSVALNSLTNVWCYQKAISDQSGSMFIPDLPMEQVLNFASLEIGNNTDPQVQGEYVSAMKVDDLALNACHFMKIDVEGMEERVLRGAVHTLTSYSPILYVENNRRDRAASLIRFIDSLGYDLYWHTPRAYNPSNYAMNPDNIFGELGDINMLCIPRISSIQVTDPFLEKIQVENNSNLFPF
jgi:FkbM family methyltransferase